MNQSNRLVTLKKNREYAFVYRRGKSFGGHYMVLVLVPRSYGGLRTGFSVSKKVGNAVVRNLARRRLKESFRRFLPYIKRDAQIIWIARRPIAQAEFSGILREMEYLLKKAGLLKKEDAGCARQDAGALGK